MSKIRINWSREELILALSLYCKLPFGKLHHKNDDIIKMAELIGRSPNALAMKLVNFASFDLSHRKRGVKGLSNSGKEDKKIWDEFSYDWEKLIFDAELIKSEIAKDKEHSDIITKAFKTPDISKSEKLLMVKVRLLQSFFREVVLSSYNYSCAGKRPVRCMVRRRG
jgi:putative restriction endonuclease